MASEGLEESAVYDEEFEEEHEDGQVLHVTPAVPPLVSQALAATAERQCTSAVPACTVMPATAALTDAELDDYLEFEDAGVTNQHNSSAADAYASSGAVAEPAEHSPNSVSHAESPQLSEPPSDLETQPNSEHYGAAAASGQSQASHNSHHTSRPGSRQLSKNTSSRSRKSSRRASGSSTNGAHTASVGPLHASRAETGGQLLRLGDAGIQVPVGDDVDHQQNSISTTACELPSCKPSKPSIGQTAQESYRLTHQEVAWPTQAQVAQHPGWLAAPADSHTHPQQPSFPSMHDVQHQYAALQMASGQKPNTPAAAEIVFSNNAVAAAAAAAAAIAAADVAIAQAAGASVLHTTDNKQLRPVSASAGARQDKQQRKHMPQRVAADNSWYVEGHQSECQQCCQPHAPVQVLPVQQWAVPDVCDWVEGIGLSQYRKKFMHNCINGRLLLKLKDDVLKKELGVGPLGHRALILDTVELLQAADLAAAAVAAATGITVEQVAPEGTSPAVATALLVSACVAARAAARQTHGGGSIGAATAAACVPVKCNHHGGFASAAGANNNNNREGEWELNCCGSREGSVTNDIPLAGSRCRPISAPCGRKTGRSMSPQALSPGALGPAAGRVSVYEQRAKLLFKLGRAQARAATQSSTAARVGGAARIAANEVARLQGQLADLDRKNRVQVQHSAGSVDSQGHIPWQHVGPGTHAANPHPECFARSWDPPEADLTFKPKISKNSQRIMAEAQGGFLDRLNNDLKRRQVKQKELQRRYNALGVSVSAADAAAAAKAYAAALQLVSGYLGQRGWAELNIPSGVAGSIDVGLQQEIDEQLDEIVDSHAKDLSLGDAQRAGILAACGVKKVALLAAAVRAQQFMDRYKADLTTRDGRLLELQQKWLKQQLQRVPVATGPTGRAPAVPLTAVQRDMRQALLCFRQLGWEVEEPEDECDDLLDALIKRAQAYKTEVEKLHDKAAAACAVGQQMHAVLEPNINWQSAPWSVDGLNPLIQNAIDARKAATDKAATKSAALNKPAAADAALKAAGQHTSSKGSTGSPADTATSNSSRPPLNPLDHAVKLLAGMRWDGLSLLEAASGRAKKLAVYRALRTQQFLEFTANDLASREAKQRAIWEEIEASRRSKLVSKQELNAFYERLQTDGEKRKTELAKAQADKADREQRALALVSIGAGRSTCSRPHSAR